MYVNFNSLRSTNRQQLIPPNCEIDKYFQGTSYPWYLFTKKCVLLFIGENVIWKTGNLTSFELFYAIKLLL